MLYKIKKIISLLLLSTITFNFVFIDVNALTGNALIEKEQLINYYYGINEDINSSLDDVINYVDKYESVLSSTITVDNVIKLLNYTVNRDKEGFINYLYEALGENTNAINDLKAIESSVRLLLSQENIDYFKDVLNFLKNETYNLTVKDIFDFMNETQDTYTKGLLLIDKLNTIFNNSELGVINLIELFQMEFSDLNTKIEDTYLALMDNQDTLLINKLEAIKNNQSLTVNEKVLKFVDIIIYIEEAKAEYLLKENNIYNQLNNEYLKAYLNDKADIAINNVDEAIIYAKKYLIDNMTLKPINNTLALEEREDIILPVYGVVASQDSQLNVINTNKYIISPGYFFDINYLIKNTNNLYGSRIYQNLKNNRIATGSTMTINNGVENIITYTFVVKGDLLGRGVTDTTDLFRLIDGALGRNPLNGVYREAADMNNDKRNDISDIIRLIDTILEDKA